MEPEGKVAAIFTLISVFSLGLWQFTSPRTLPRVGIKYVGSGSSTRRSWVLKTSSSAGKACLAFGTANLTFPRLSLPTTYSLIISVVNETVTNSYAKSYSIRMTSLALLDNYYGGTNSWGKTNDLPDAAQATSLFFFKTSATPELKFTATYSSTTSYYSATLPTKRGPNRST